MKRILIVEDEVAIREFEAINLKRVGYEVEEAGSGEEALDIYDNDPNGFDIALLDISMPGIDGFELCARIRKTHTYPIIMLTAETMRSSMQNPFSFLTIRSQFNFYVFYCTCFC